MLRSIDMEALGFQRDGSVYCPACARRKFGELIPAQCEAGLCERLEPLSRYTLEESAGERGWEDAQTRISRFVEEHPRLGLLISPDVRHGFTLRIAMDYGREQCEDCGKWITPSHGQALKAEREYEARCLANGRMPGGLWT